jgi:hypothetical protein
MKEQKYNRTSTITDRVAKKGRGKEKGRRGLEKVTDETHLCLRGGWYIYLGPITIGTME